MAVRYHMGHFVLRAGAAQAPGSPDLTTFPLSPDLLRLIRTVRRTSTSAAMANAISLRASRRRATALANAFSASSGSLFVGFFFMTRAQFAPDTPEQPSEILLYRSGRSTGMSADHLLQRAAQSKKFTRFTYATLRIFSDTPGWKSGR